jgi:hypothetical protein
MVREDDSYTDLNVVSVYSGVQQYRADNEWLWRGRIRLGGYQVFGQKEIYEGRIWVKQNHFLEV